MSGANFEKRFALFFIYSSGKPHNNIVAIQFISKVKVWEEKAPITTKHHNFYTESKKLLE